MLIEFAASPKHRARLRSANNEYPLTGFGVTTQLLLNKLGKASQLEGVSVEQLANANKQATELMAETAGS